MKHTESPRRKKARALLSRHGYAVGGHVTQAIAEAAPAHATQRGKKSNKISLRRGLRSGGAAEGAQPRLRADKPRRAPFDKRSGGGRAKKAGTKIIIVNGHPPIPGPGAGMPVPHPGLVPMGTAPTAPLPVAARPPPERLSKGAQPMPGVAPPGLVHSPMAQRGGRMGARPHMTAGSKNALGRLQKMRAYGHPSSNRADE